MFVRLPFFLCVFAVLSTPVFAQEEEPTRENLNRKLSEISDSLDESQSHHFNMMYSNYALISTVKRVQGEVGKAINACGENNADMKGNLDNRFAEWNGAVDPVMTEATNNLNNMVLAQDYASKEEMDALFAQVDQTRMHAENQIEKIPVTTPEACTYLMNKMDETQASMIALLKQTLMPASQLTPKPKAEEAMPEAPESTPAE